MPGPPLGAVFDRFWSMVDVQGPDECWPWLAKTDARGYGRFAIKEGDRWTHRLAHRVAWVLANGMLVPEGLCVCHSCDNPPCCNFGHLWTGTAAENWDDMRAKGRARGNPTRGESRPNAKLSDAEAESIRVTYATGTVTQQQIAATFGVTQAQVSNIVRGKQRAGT